MPGLPPSLKVYLKKKKYICLPFFSREERKVKRENSREYRPFLMAVIDPIYVYATKPEKPSKQQGTEILDEAKDTSNSSPTFWF